MPPHQGFGLVTLSVSDLERSADFYNRAFSAQAMAGEDELGPFVLCLGQNFMLGLRRWESTPDGDTFRFDRVGLDHMGIHVDGDAESTSGEPTSRSRASTATARSPAPTERTST